MAEMPYTEYLNWLEYFKKRPIGWREDDRTHKLLQAQGVKAKPWEIFGSLVAIYKSTKKEGFDTGSFKASTMFHKLLSAKGGDKVLHEIKDE